jgi:hypothetical protein
LPRFEFGSAVTVELWLQTTRVFFGTSIVAGVIGCLVWQVAARASCNNMPLQHARL